MIKGRKKLPCARSPRPSHCLGRRARPACGRRTPWRKPGRAGPFTDAQAQAGQALYMSRCASCHDAGGETARLFGASFTDVWKTRTTRDLYARIKTTMPFNDPGSLSEAAAASVVGVCSQDQRGRGRHRRLHPNDCGGDQQHHRGAGGAAIRRADPYAGYVSLSGMPAATGITVPGTVANYTPVTEEMLLHPPAADWLMHYQNYAGWSHSPLKQINTKNVQQSAASLGLVDGRWRAPADHAPGA